MNSQYIWQLRQKMDSFIILCDHVSPGLKWYWIWRVTFGNWICRLPDLIFMACYMKHHNSFSPYIVCYMNQHWWFFPGPMWWQNCTCQRLVFSFTNPPPKKKTTFNSLRFSDAYMRLWTRPSLIQIMAFCQISAKPLSGAMLPYCHFILASMC